MYSDPFALTLEPWIWVLSIFISHLWMFLHPYLGRDSICIDVHAHFQMSDDISGWPRRRWLEAPPWPVNYITLQYQVIVHLKSLLEVLSTVQFCIITTLNSFFRQLNGWTSAGSHLSTEVSCFWRFMDPEWKVNWSIKETIFLGSLELHTIPMKCSFLTRTQP